MHSIWSNDDPNICSPLMASSFDLTLAAPAPQSWSVLDIESPRVISVKVSTPQVKCFHYEFTPPPRPTVAQDRRTYSKLVPGDRKSRRHIKPSDDVVKLQDRLYYVLQPSLETLLIANELILPHEPFPYQFDGISFLYPRHSAILADEMGLGKTMQAITSLRLLLHAREIQRVILICPKPLISNWKREFSLWAPEISVMVVKGSTQQRSWAWRQPEFPVKITNYESVLRDVDLVEDETISADLVVLDEAQRIKNSSSSTSNVVRRVTRRRSWALTGTPIENSTDDLVGIFEFVSPGLISHHMSPRNMARSTSDYVMRRTKDDVLVDLPPKLFCDVALELAEEQQTSYSLAEDDGIFRLSKLGKNITIQHVFELILRLKQICNFDPATGASSKLEHLLADLEEVAQSGKKAIVFSQWVNTLQRLADELKLFRPLQYHGRVSISAREKAIQDFRASNKHTVMLISYGAGSVGLNLQCSNYVFLFDRWWNPAVEDQAINRAHRIGSSGPVTITRFVTPNTIEQRIDDVLRQKRKLMRMVLGNQDGPRQMGFSQEEIFGLFGLRLPK